MAWISAEKSASLCKQDHFVTQFEKGNERLRKNKDFKEKIKQRSMSEGSTKGRKLLKDTSPWPYGGTLLSLDSCRMFPEEATATPRGGGTRRSGDQVLRIPTSPRANLLKPQTSLL